MTHRPAALPPNENLRIKALEDLAILDTAPELQFDDVVFLAGELCDTPINLVSLVDRQRQWFKASMGLDACETHRDLAFCAHAILEPEKILEVRDARLDLRFSHSPLVLGPPHIRFYAGAPIVTSDGMALGTVCVIDTTPRILSDPQRRGLRALARQTAALLELRKAHAAKVVDATHLRQKVTAALADDSHLHGGIQQRQRLASVGELTSGLAHDFNNLLQAVDVSFQLIERRADSPGDVRRWAGSGQQAVQRGARLIAQLLSFSREGAGEGAVVVVDRHLGQFKELFARALGPEIEIAFELHSPDGAVLCDGAQLDAAVLNLMINARDAMNHVGRITLGSRQVELAGDPDLPDGAYLRLSIQDTGPGMPEAVMRRAFEPFFTTKGDGKGTGLGLAQVYGFAQKAGGIARIESAPQRGTVVSLWLKTVANHLGLPEVEDPGQVAAINTTYARILLVDQHDELQAMLGELLTHAGYRVESVSSGLAALNAIERQMPDVVLTDCAMQGMSGVALARVLRDMHPRLPVLLLTGQADLAALQSRLEPDAVILQKPIGFDLLTTRIAAALAPPLRQPIE